MPHALYYLALAGCAAQLAISLVAWLLYQLGGGDMYGLGLPGYFAFMGLLVAGLLAVGAILIAVAGAVLYLPVLVFKKNSANAIRIGVILVCLLTPLLFLYPGYGDFSELQAFYSAGTFLKAPWLIGLTVYVVLFLIYRFVIVPAGSEAPIAERTDT